MTEEVCNFLTDFSIKVNICLMLLYWELPETRKCLTASCYYCSSICPSGVSRKPGGQN